MQQLTEHNETTRTDALAWERRRFSATLRLQEAIIDAGDNFNYVCSLMAHYGAAYTQTTGISVWVRQDNHFVLEYPDETFIHSRRAISVESALLPSELYSTSRTFRSSAAVFGRADQAVTLQSDHVLNSAVTPIILRGAVTGILVFEFPPEADITDAECEICQLLANCLIRNLQPLPQIEANQALAKSEQRFRTCVSTMEEGLVMQGLHGEILLCNESAERILGMSHDQMAGRTSLDERWRAVHEDGSAFHGHDHPAMATLRDGTPRFGIKMGIHKSDDSLTWISVNAVPTYETGGTVLTGVVCTFTDVTERIYAEEALQKSEEALRTVTEGAPVILYATDINGIFTISEGKALSTIGLAAGQAVGLSVFDIYNDKPEIISGLKAVLAGATIAYDVWIDKTCFHSSVRPKYDAVGTITGIIGVSYDVTEQRLAEAQVRDYAIVLEFQKRELELANGELELLATTDGLTGVKNHRAFQESYAHELGMASRYGMPLCVVMLDVDDFKPYNDSFGHPAGDDVLRTIAAVLAEHARETDVVARYGGEEFVILLPQTDLAGALTIAERMRAEIETAPWPLRPVTASFGVAMLTPGTQDGAVLVARADSALYQSKSDGRNRVTKWAPSHDSSIPT